MSKSALSDGVTQQSATAASPTNNKLAATVRTALDNSPYVEPGKFRVEAEQGAVQLHGQVETFFEKQMAQEVLRRVDGVERIVNHLEVSW